MSFRPCFRASHLSLGVLAWAISACSSPDSAGEATAAAPLPAQASASVASRSLGGQPRVIEHRRPFSAAKASDQFRLQLDGDSLLQASITFSIAQASGKVIFQETFQATDLEAPLVYELNGAPATAARREAFVQKRLQSFFDNKSFVTPALQPKLGNVSPELDAAALKALAQPGTVGFGYLLGKEDGRYIAWVPAAGKVVRYVSFGG